MKKISFLFSFLSITTVGFGQEAKLPKNWFNLDLAKDGVFGVSSEKAYQELLGGKKTKTVIVAVIDSGVDTQHEDLKDKIWVNAGEIPNNGIDDDKNGFIDDVNGWDFIGGKDGTDIKDETLELTREYKRLKNKYLKIGKDSTNDVEFEYYKKVRTDYNAKLAENTQYLNAYQSMFKSIDAATTILKTNLNKTELTEKDFEVNTDDDKKTKAAKQLLFYYNSKGVSYQKLKDGVDDLEGKAKIGFNLDYDSRKIIGDDPKSLTESNYGNAEVRGPDATHGTHVSGIIAANRDNNIGINGIANDVKIMVIRAVPNGDERDKDVANAIKYAVNNGAKIINMSFGKSLSPQKEIVEKAVAYAELKGVLLVHAAGNDSQNIDEGDNFPTAKRTKGSKPNNWIEVGASSTLDNEELAATFSNYGKKEVTLFAPGTTILSCTPDSKYLEEEIGRASCRERV